jgi:hypothetical protein
MPKRPLRLVTGRSTALPPEEMSPGDLLYRLAILSPKDYRAVIAIARERYKALWPHNEDILLLTDTNPK